MRSTTLTGALASQHISARNKTNGSIVAHHHHHHHHFISSLKPSVSSYLSVQVSVSTDFLPVEHLFNHTTRLYIFATLKTVGTISHLCLLTEFHNYSTLRLIIVTDTLIVAKLADSSSFHQTNDCVRSHFEA